MPRVPVQSLTVSLLLVSFSPLAAQEGSWPALRPLGSDELVVFLKVLEVVGDGLKTVALNHRFGPQDRFVFEVSPSRGGYVALFGLGPGDHLEQRIWPPEAAGYAVTAQVFARLPSAHSLSVSGKGPTRLALLFSLTPLAGGAPPPPAPVRAPASPRKWLSQIRLRDIVVNRASLPEEPTAVYQGTLAAGGPVVIRIELMPVEKRP